MIEYVWDGGGGGGGVEAEEARSRGWLGESGMTYGNILTSVIDDARSEGFGLTTEVAARARARAKARAESRPRKREMLVEWE